MFSTEEWSAIQMITFLSGIGEYYANATLSNQNVQNLMKHENHFDAVVAEVFWVEALYGKDQGWKRVERLFEPDGIYVSMLLVPCNKFRNLVLLFG